MWSFICDEYTVFLRPCRTAIHGVFYPFIGTIQIWIKFRCDIYRIADPFVWILVCRKFVDRYIARFFLIDFHSEGFIHHGFIGITTLCDYGLKLIDMRSGCIYGDSLSGCIRLPSSISSTFDLGSYFDC